MKLGIAFDCAATSAVEVLAYLAWNGLQPDVTVFFGAELPDFAHAAQLYACCDGFVFFRGETVGIGYDRYLRWSASAPPTEARLPRNALYGRHRTVMRAYLRRCGCERLLLFSDDTEAKTEAQTLVLPNSEQTGDFLQANEAKLFLMLAASPTVR